MRNSCMKKGINRRILLSSSLPRHSLSEERRAPSWILIVARRHFMELRKHLGLPTPPSRRKRREVCLRCMEWLKE